MFTRFSNRNALILAALAVSAASQAAGTITLFAPHKTVSQGITQSIVFSGRIDITADYNSMSLHYFHAFKDGGYSDVITAGNVSSNFLTWLGTIGSHLTGAVYEGTLFEMDQLAANPAGFYNHTGFALNDTPTAYMEFDSNTPQYVRSNEAEYTINVVPEPATMVALGAGLVAVIRRRNSK